MAAEDARVRAELAEDGSLFDGYHPTMRAVHDRNAARLREILDLRGWPTEPLVGVDGAKAAWIVVQHAIGHPALQRRALASLEAAAGRGDVPRVQVAMLEDRIRSFEGRPQRFGTQFDWDESGEMSPLPCEDPEGIDDRRRAVGLPPLAEAIAAQRHWVAESTERSPADRAARKREMERWLASVGWRS